jgi:Acetyltransferase (GNAT) domain
LDIFGIIAPEDDAWEHSLSGLPYDFFHTPTFARAWQSELGLPVRLIVYRRGDSSVILPIVFRAIEADRSRALKDAVSPYGFPGPVMVPAPGVDLQRLVAEFLEALRTGLREIGCVSMFARMQPLSPFNELFQNAGAKLVVQGPVVFVDLARPMQEVRASYRSNHRRDIQRLARAGFEPFQQEKGWADFFYELYLQTMQRRSADSFYFFSREMFHRLEEVPRNNLRLVGCRRAGEVVCAALITRGAGIANYFLGGTRVEYLQHAPSKLMFDQAFEWEQAAGSERFILGGGLGSCVDSLLNFKRGFSILSCDYVTWREIFNLEEYRALVSETATTERDQRELSSFFPPYRSRSAQDSPGNDAGGP